MRPIVPSRGPPEKDRHVGVELIVIMLQLLSRIINMGGRPDDRPTYLLYCTSHQHARGPTEIWGA